MIKLFYYYIRLKMKYHYNITQNMEMWDKLFKLKKELTKWL
nr:MAG TPA: hypothetical protein [Caudoviricetes sp.]